MDECKVIFFPQNKTVSVSKETTLLEAASQADITINNLCGGDGICGRCKMIVKTGEVGGRVTGKLSREQIKTGYVLACMSYVKSDLTVEIPSEILAKEKILADEDAGRFVNFEDEANEVREAMPLYQGKYKPSPLVTKIYLELEQATLTNNVADHQRISDAVRKKLKYRSVQMGLKIIKSLPRILRESDFRATATVGLRRDITEVMNVEGGDTSGRNYMVVIDIGTTTVVAHLVDANATTTIAAEACFNSQAIYGGEVTGRMISAEKRGTEELQKLLVEDINRLIGGLAESNKINLKDITAVICAGNTAMSHFLVGLPTSNIRRTPYVPASVELPPLRAAEVDIQINPRGLLYSLPGISGWVGSDLTAGILATGMHESEELSLLVDIGTNGEIIVGNKEWIVACSASAGPALEGAGVECGMRAERGAIERVTSENGKINFKTIGKAPAKGICGSGIIDLVSVLLNERLINRTGKFVALTQAAQVNADRIQEVDGIKRFLLSPEIFISELDIENVITAKAAIFAAIKIIFDRLDLEFSDIAHCYLAGAFGSYIDVANAINIGLIPDIDRDRIEFVGNTSIKGAKIVAFYKEAFYQIVRVQKLTTYYDLMGAHDYVEEFRKALFLPHTDIELFRRQETWQPA